MEMRVEQLSARTGVSVDTIRYYQNKGLLEPPRREGRVAWYGEAHQARLERIRALQQRGFTLATIARLVSGELDAADEALLAELSGVSDRAVTGDGSSAGDGPRPPSPTGHETADRGSSGPGGGPGGRPGEPEVASERTFTLPELADVTGVPLAVLKAVEAESLLIPRRIGTEERYTEEDVAAARAGLLLLDWGIPLSTLLDLARRHHEATEVVAAEAVAMFSAHIREPLRQGRSPRTGRSSPPTEPGEPDVEGLLQAYAELLPAVNTLVGHHFTRTLVKAALDHVERLGSPAERQAVHERIRATGEGDGNAGRPEGAGRRTRSAPAVPPASIGTDAVDRAQPR